MSRYAFNYSTASIWGSNIAKALDIAIICMCGWLSYVAYFSSIDFTEERYSWAILVGMFLAAFLFPCFQLYASWKGCGIANILYKILAAYVVWIISIIIVLFLFGISIKFSRGWLVLWTISSLLSSVFIRIISFFIYKKILLKEKYKVILIGDEIYCHEVEMALKKDKNSDFCVNRILPIPNENIHSIHKEIENLKIDNEEVWICLPISRGDDVVLIVNAFSNKSINIRFVPGLKEMRLINHNISFFSGVRLIDISCSPMTVGKGFIKRFEDLIFSSFILLLIFPVMLLVAIGVKLSSPGPVFYRQARISWNGKVFNMLKFRSMSLDNECDDNIKWGNAAQKKITPLGKFIRKTSLDELPQFINVLKGDMSIVGPRPERDIFVKKFKEEIPGYMQKHMVKAGITGWAQIHGLRGDTSLERRIEYDLSYIENWSVWLDIKIIAITILKFLFDKNAA